MIKFINRVTGSEMWVHESRVDEYLAAGHRPAAAPAPEKKPAAQRTQKPRTKK